MIKRLRSGRPVSGRSIPVLAALLLSAAPGSLRAAEKGREQVPLLPADAAAFITLRPAHLAGKMGVKEPARSLPWLGEWKRKVGLPLTGLERCTVVFQAPDGADDPSHCWILQTLHPYHRGTVLKAWAPGATLVKRNGKICHVSGEGGPTVHFINDHTLIVADRAETVAWWLKRPTPRPGDPPSTAWRMADKHDLVAWSRTFAIDSLPAPAASASIARPGTRRALVSVSRKHRVAPPAGKTNQPVTTPLLMMALPFGLEFATMTLDVGDRLNLEIGLTCRDPASAGEGSKILRALCDCCRGTLLLTLGEIGMGPLLDVGEKPGPRLPMALLRKTEKALASVRIRPEGKTIPMSVRIDMNAKKLWSELTRCGKLCDGRFAKLCDRPIAADGPPIPPTLPAPLETPVAIPVPPPPPAGTAWPPPQPVPAPAEVRTARLTVANVTKDPALLFTMTDNGKLVFAKEVPAGDAVDFETTTGQRWVAVFKSARARTWTAAGDRSGAAEGSLRQAGYGTTPLTAPDSTPSSQPVGETYLPSKAKATWLLR